MRYRMEELKKINKSLSALGDVIAALSDGAKFVPYNNSVLTTLLRESLGGNSKTMYVDFLLFFSLIVALFFVLVLFGMWSWVFFFLGSMMATISPANDNFDETLSTLRYAERVKKIKTLARKNAGDNKETVERELRQEIAKLKKLLELRGTGNKDQVKQLESYLENSRDELRRVKMQHQEKVVEMRKTYEQMKRRLKEMGLVELDATKQPAEVPKLINLSGDPALSGHMVFFLIGETIHIGTEQAKPKPLIMLSSHDSSIKANHAIIRCKKTKESQKAKALDVACFSCFWCFFLLSFFFFLYPLFLFVLFCIVVATLTEITSMEIIV